MSAPTNAGLLGVFAHLDALLAAIRACQKQRLEISEVFSPVPSEEILALVAPRRSPVRFITFFGAVAGLITGLGLALYTSAVWELAVGGKPVYSIIPFVVVGFELTILLGALFTLLGLLLFARLPFRAFPAPAYRPEFSDDRFGLWLTPPASEQDRTRELLRAAGAERVEDVMLDEGSPLTEVPS